MDYYVKMSKILSQDEVDVLLRGMTGGEIEVENDTPQLDSLDSRILSHIITENTVTPENFEKHIRELGNDPFSILEYIGLINTYHNLSRLDISDKVADWMSQIQNVAIKAARNQARIDKLTGMNNRGSIEEKMRQPKSYYACMMIDIDHFKDVNDKYGHSVGDLVIQSVAKIILDSVREVSIDRYAGRYGGEEFYVELNQTDKEGARIAAERVRDAIEQKTTSYVVERLQHQERYDDAKKFSKEKITVSIGVADYKKDINDPEKKVNPLITRDKADKALYNAKYFGRNRVLVDGDLPINEIDKLKRPIFTFANFLGSISEKLDTKADKMRAYSTKK